MKIQRNKIQKKDMIYAIDMMLKSIIKIEKKIDLIEDSEKRRWKQMNELIKMLVNQNKNLKLEV